MPSTLVKNYKKEYTNVVVRVTAEEHACILKKAEEVGAHSMSDYMRFLLDMPNYISGNKKLGVEK